MVDRQKYKKVGGVYSSFLILFFFLLFTACAYTQTLPETVVNQSAADVWQREQFIITLTVNTDDPFARLQMDDFKHRGFTILPLDQKRKETTGSTQLITQWVIIPFSAGTYSLELPRVRYRPNRGRIVTLQLPAIHIKVHHLPVYVPPTMPVGKISLSANWHQGKLIQTHKLLDTQIIVKASGVIKEALPPLTPLLKSNAEIEFLPAQKNIHSELDADGLHQRVTYTVPFKALKNGRLRFPSISIQYFDPSDALLKRATLNPPTIIAMQPWIRVSIGLFLLFLFIALGIYLITRFKHFMQSVTRRRHILKKLQQADDYTQIKSALEQFAILQGWPGNLSLDDFARYWEQKYGPSPTLSDNIKALQSFQFSANHPDNIQSIRDALAKQLK